MNTPTAWWILAGVLVAAELGTGTFYLLMLALGAAAGALAAHAGLAPVWHWVAFAAVGGGAVVLLHLLRRRLRARHAAEDARIDRLDLGATVTVSHWAADGTARVAYRGSEWSARLAAAGAACPGLHRVVGQDGNVLLLAPVGDNAPPSPPCI